MTDRDCKDSWTTIADCVARSLTESDDARLWDLAIAEIFRDAEYLSGHTRSKSPIFAEVGTCSHWQRPHQHRWLKDGGFAAPYGYDGTGFNIHANPEFDWSLCFRWNADDHCWIAVEKIRGKRPLTFRVTVPTRTKTHNQAAVHTVWTPGSPTAPDQEAIRLYGFRREDDHWQCTATAGHESPYEIPEGDE